MALLQINQDLCYAPADLYDVDNPDWAPNVNLGHPKYVSNSLEAMKSMQRYVRYSSRSKQSPEFAEANGLLQLSIQPCK